MFVIVRISIGFVIAVSGLYEIGSNFSLGCTALLSGGFIVLAGVERLCRTDDVPDVPGTNGGEDMRPNELFTAETQGTQATRRTRGRHGTRGTEGTEGARAIGEESY